MLCLPGISLGSFLRSFASAGTIVPLFTDFTGNTPEFDFSMPCIFGYGFFLFSAIQPRSRDRMETSQIPVQCERAWLGSLSPRHFELPREIGGLDVAFRQL